MTSLFRKRITARYRCSKCHDRLVELCEDGQWIVVCGTDRKHYGFVTEYFLDRQKAQAQSEWPVLKGLYPELAPPPIDIKESIALLYGEEF